MPFNPDAKVAEQLLISYYSDFKKPSAFVFVLDVSGSMNKEGREQQMKDAIAALTVNVETNSRFAKLRNREKVWVIPFSQDVQDVRAFNINGPNDLVEINSYVQSLTMDGGTALFSATDKAVDVLQSKMNELKDYRFSVVVLTDGEANKGMSADSFVKKFKERNLGDGAIRVFPILFGGAQTSELEAIAKVSGGRVFDGKKKALNLVFKEIRSYQ